jgi:hypothetical protein
VKVNEVGDPLIHLVLNGFGLEKMAKPVQNQVFEGKQVLCRQTGIQAGKRQPTPWLDVVGDFGLYTSQKGVQKRCF